MAISPTSRDRDAIPWLLIGAAATVLAAVAGVAAIGLTDSCWWVAAAFVLVGAGTAAGGGAVVELARGGSRRRLREVAGGTAQGPAPPWRGPEGSPRVMVVASEPFDGPLLRAGLRHDVEPGTAVLVLAPALTRTRLRYWVSDLDAAIARARAVEEESVGLLRDAGIAADGHDGSGDPLTAIEDALRFFDAGEIVLLLHRSGRRWYREQPLRDELERRFGRPVAELDPPRRRLVPRRAARA